MHMRTCHCGKEHSGPGAKCPDCLHKEIGGNGREHNPKSRID